MRTCQLGVDDRIRRTDPAAVHHVSEFLGMTSEAAEAFAGALGWTFRSCSRGGAYTDDAQINIRADDTGIVTEAWML